MKKIVIILCLFYAGTIYAMNFEQTKQMLTTAMENEKITRGESTQIINAINQISPQNLEILISLTNNKLVELNSRKAELQRQTPLPQFFSEYINTQIKRYYDILTNLVVH